MAGRWNEIEESYYLNKSAIQLSKESVLNPRAYHSFVNTSFILKMKCLRQVMFDRNFDYPTKGLLFITLSNNLVCFSMANI